MAAGDTITNGLQVFTGTNGITSSSLIPLRTGDSVGVIELGNLVASPSFTEAATLGTGQVGTGGILLPVNGRFVLGTNGATYFVPNPGSGLLGTQLSVLPVVSATPAINNYIYGDGTANTFGGSGAADIIYGGSYNTITGAPNTTGTGGDLLSGGAGTDVIFGFDGADTLNGGDGSDSLYGGLDNDILTGGAGGDRLSGGAGIDTANYSDSTAGVTVSLNGTTGIGGTAAGDTLVGIENITGSDFADSLTGDAGNNVLTGGAGNDTLAGGTGADSLFGGSGTDTADYSGQSGGITVDLVAGTSSDGDTLTSIENVIGTNGQDVLTGNGVANVLTGAGGVDVLNGGGGNDTLFGGLGNDTLIGGAGADLMDGGEGNDTVTTGRGDTALGGDGDDIFTVDDALDNPGAGSDAGITISGGANTANGPGDTLDLTGLTGFIVTPSTTVLGSGTVTLSDGTVINYNGIENVIICFTPGTMIRTLGGARAIETLKVGDMVLTRDSGMQPIRWIGKTTVAGTGSFAPIRIREGAVPGLTSDLLVSPQHRMLIEGYRAELLFGTREVLASAKHMVDNKYVTTEECAEVTYIHMLFDQHEVVFANDAATESYHPASYSLGGICPEAREELFALFPDLRSMPDSYGQAARRILKSFEVKALAW